MQTILITGGAGFIGTYLAKRLLSSGYAVRILDVLSPQIHGMVPSRDLDWLDVTAGIEFHRGSVTNRDALKAALQGVNAVVHLAAETGTGQSMYEIDRYCQENVQGTALLMQLLQDGSAPDVRHVLLSSSRSVYGEGAYTYSDDPTGLRITPQARALETLRRHEWEPVCHRTGRALKLVATREDDRTAPSSIYAATKLMQEDLVRIGCDSLGIGYTILRLQNVYGEGQSLKNPYTGILSIFSTRIRRGMELPIFEDGLESRDFVHVSDVAAAFAAAIARSEPVNDIINVGSGVATAVIDVARLLTQAFDAEERIRVTGEFRVGDIRHNLADTSRMRDLLGLEPTVSLQDGLRAFADWVLTQPLPEDQLEKANAEMAKRKMMG